MDYGIVGFLLAVHVLATDAQILCFVITGRKLATKHE